MNCVLATKIQQCLRELRTITLHALVQTRVTMLSIFSNVGAFVCAVAGVVVRHRIILV